MFIKNKACPGDTRNLRYAVDNSQIIWELAK